MEMGRKEVSNERKQSKGVQRNERKKQDAEKVGSVYFGWRRDREGERERERHCPTVD